MLIAKWTKYRLQFKRPAGTSRGVMNYKDCWFIYLSNTDDDHLVGIGECGLLRGLSYDDRPDYEDKLTELCVAINEQIPTPDLTDYPSIRFGLEMARLDLKKGGNKILFDNQFTKGTQGIPINGLIWMGKKPFMLEQIEAKLKEGYKCIKIKIGAINFEEELSIIKYIRDHYSRDEITIRVDANGGFDPYEAHEKMSRLSELSLHSIEQPIKAGLNEELAKLCQSTPLPIALDESLIPIQTLTHKKRLLEYIQPQYIILKPSFVGGYEGAQEWIDITQNLNISWWITSALESNIGLNAIAQWTASISTSTEQGLGTGQLYTNNIPSPLQIDNGQLWYHKHLLWGKTSNYVS